MNNGSGVVPTCLGLIIALLLLSAVFAAISLGIIIAWHHISAI